MSVKYHNESIKIKDELVRQKSSLKGGIKFSLGRYSVQINSKDGIGGLIEEWLGIWCDSNGFNIRRPRLGTSQTFPDYFVGSNRHLLEIKTFNDEASPAFDLANFDSYCKSVADTPSRVDADYLIMSYKLNGGLLSIERVWLKKIWEITSPSARWALKTQTKKSVIYNIRPATWYASNLKYGVFQSKEDFVEALFKTQEQYKGFSYIEEYNKNANQMF